MTDHRITITLNEDEVIPMHVEPLQFPDDLPHPGEAARMQYESMGLEESERADKMMEKLLELTGLPVILMSPHSIEPIYQACHRIGIAPDEWIGRAITLMLKIDEHTGKLADAADVTTSITLKIEKAYVR